MKFLCGWCPQPENIPLTEEISHDICSVHKREILDQSDARQFMKGNPPSYVSDREKFYEYKERQSRR